MPKPDDDLSRRKELFGVPYEDKGHLTEHERIVEAGTVVMQHEVGWVLGLVIEKEGKRPGYDKANRYIRGILAMFPELQCKAMQGPIDNSVLVQVTRRKGKSGRAGLGTELSGKDEPS